MRIAHLGPPPQPVTLADAIDVYRIQPSMPRTTSVVVGPVIMAPRGTLACRFDLPSAEVGYFTFDATTAMYETFARREVALIPLALLGVRSLLTLRIATAGLNIADLRPYATDWPALQATRYGATQQLAVDVQRAGFDGALYRSAQQFGADCLALFGPAVSKVSLVSSDVLYDIATSRLHLCTVDAARGAELPII
jgi:hypothetical protein